MERSRREGTERSSSDGKSRIHPVSTTRRTTLTLPADCLDQAAKIAKVRHVSLSVVMSEALAEGLRTQLEASRSEEILEAYKQAFAGFTEDELLTLDGIIVEPSSSSMSGGGR